VGNWQFKTNRPWDANKPSAGLKKETVALMRNDNECFLALDLDGVKVDGMSEPRDICSWCIFRE
jgi:hypothetical protein